LKANIENMNTKIRTLSAIRPFKALNKQIKRRDMAITANEDVSIFLYLTKETTSGYKENIIKQRNSFTPYFTTAHPSDWAHSPKQSQV
jgi:hypothetical protein